MEAGPYLRIGKALADEVHDLELFVSKGCPRALRYGEVLHGSKLGPDGTPHIVQLSDIAAFSWFPVLQWGRLDSNQRPPDYESGALTN